jgi:monothiol glutaredoxin
MQAPLLHLDKLVNQHPILLFAKGTPERPMCQASADLFEILADNQVAATVIDIQTDPEIRAYLPSFSGSNAIPLLYINGELVGDAEVLKGMATALGPLLKDAARCAFYVEEGSLNAA